MLSFVRQTLLCRTSISSLSTKRLPALIGAPSPSILSKLSTSRTRRQDLEPSVPTAELPMTRPFDPQLPAVSVAGPDGSVSRYNICPTPKANLDKLSRELEGLLSHHEKHDSEQNFARKRWILDERGDAIHRHLEFESGQVATRFRAALLAASDEMNHHAHITGDHALTVTCTTHNPRGLSMRDVRLAKKVDELATQYHAYVSTTASALDLARKGEQRKVNRHAISEALENQRGACFPSDKRAAKLSI